jgi:protein SCO1/2
MRAPIVFLLGVAIVAASCGRTAQAERQFILQGQIQSIDPARTSAVIKHEDVKGFMPAMTMPYEVREARALDGLVPGDLINATLVVQSNGAYLTAITKVGSAPLEKPAAANPAPSASAGFELLRVGEHVPDGVFVDQDGRTRHFSDFKGSPVAMTFIYTKCPLPTFCPLMDRHFAAMQKTLKSDPALKNVHLVTISFDPVTDTPPVLKAHAKTLDADLARWTFLTGDRDEIDQFASRFGVQVARSMTDASDITHNLRTVIIGADGTLVKTYTGNDWTTEQLLADLRGVPAKS